MSQCRVHLTHPDKTQARCLLDADHLLDDSDHLDEHGHTAKVLVRQASIEEVRRVSEAADTADQAVQRVCRRCGRTLVDEDDTGWYYQIPVSHPDMPGFTFMDRVHRCDGQPHDVGQRRDALRLYLWRDVLHDYSAGMAFAIAASADDARILLQAQVYGDYHSDLDKEPEIHELTEPFAAYVLGGG